MSDPVARARLCIGKGCIYRLGKGGMNPADPLPWGAIAACDCSGFALWALGMSRLQGETWYDTTRIAHDARKEQGLFTEVPWELARPGDLLVYGDSGGHQGHVGVVSQSGADGPEMAIHCSMGNWKRTGDAVQETGVALWRRPDTVVARRLPQEGQG